MQQSAHIQEQIRQAARGNLEALAGLMLAYAPDLRLWLAAQVDSFAAIASLELQIWTVVQRHLGEYDDSLPFSEWLNALAHDPLIRHLQIALVRSVAVQDIAVNRLVRDSLASASDGSEAGVLKLNALRDIVPEATWALVTARYRDRQPLGVIALREGTDEATVANALVAARARCDWRGIANPPAQGDRDLPPIIEDLLSGIIDNASRGMMADYLSRDPAHAQQVARQIRVHVALRALFMPFTQVHATILARQVLAGGAKAGHVVTSAPVRVPVVRYSAVNETPQNSSSQSNLPPPSKPVSNSRLSNTQARVDDEYDEPATSYRKASPRGASPLPYVIAAVLLVGGVAGLILFNRTDNGHTKLPVPAVSPEIVKPLPTPENKDPVVPNKDPVVSNKDPEVAPEVPPSHRPPTLPVSPGSAKQPDGPLRVTLVGVVANSYSYTGRELTLRTVLSTDKDISRVEYWNGENKLGEATSSPWTLVWTPPAGALSLSAHAVAQNGDITKSPIIALTAVTPLGSGSLRRDWWTGLSNLSVKDVEKIAGFPAAPKGTAVVDQFQAPSNWSDNYLQRIWGYVTPPVDGDYVFWITADDESELWLSSDENAQSSQRIAASGRVRGGMKPTDWERQPGQRSQPIRLQAGRRYFIEARHREVGGEDHVAVGWLLPDGTLERPIPGMHLSPPSEPVPTTSPPPPTEPTTPPPPPTAPVTAVVTTPPVITYSVVRALNLGGDTVEIDGVTWLGQRQAEEEGESPANSHQPGPWLSSQEWTNATNGYGPVRVDRSANDKPLTINGKVYAKGLGVHARSDVAFALDGRWSKFNALVGIDDAADASKAQVIFQVWLDGKRVWDSGIVKKGNPPKPVSVPLAGRKELRLVVDPSGPIDFDHANWVDAQFMIPGGNDGMLMVKHGKRSMANYTPNPAVEGGMRSLLTSAISGSGKEGVEFDVRVPNGPLRVWLVVGESGTSNSRQFELGVDGTALPTMTGMPAGSWQKIGPVDLVVTDKLITVKATPIKGTPQLMGFLVERPELPVTAPILSHTDPLLAIADAAGYAQVYHADLEKIGKEVPYQVDNSGSLKGAFTRVAYLLELKKKDEPVRWVWTSMDAFTTNMSHLAVPTIGSGAFFHQKVANLVVISNVEGLPTGAVGEGIIEFFPNSYHGKNEKGFPGATNDYDFGDNPGTQPSDGHGSMQVHNLGAKQTVWALNNWRNGAKADLGIGPSPTGGDWTFAKNADQYELKRLRVFVKGGP